jgi:hypothetical protein
MSRSRLVAYWVTTGWVAMGMVSGGVAHVLHVQAEPGEQDALAEGGYVVLVGVPDPLRARLQRKSH